MKLLPLYCNYDGASRRMSSGPVNVLTGPYTAGKKHPAYEFGYEPDHFQKWSFECINREEHVLVTAHTGSGKTAVAIYAIAYFLRQGKRVMYTSPIKALSNQKYKEMKELFEVKFSEIIGRPIEVGIMTGDEKIKPNADLVIMTTEILRNALYDIGKREGSVFEEDFIEHLGCVVFDEVHYINDEERGTVWEETINLLDPRVVMVMLSATIDQPERFAEWIAGKTEGVPVNLIPTSHRVVPLEHFIFVDGKLYTIMDSGENFSDEQYDIAAKAQREMEAAAKRKGISRVHKLNKMVEFMKKKNMLQAIFFAFSKANCEKFAQAITCGLIEGDEMAEISRIFNHHMHRHEKALEAEQEFMDQFRRLKAMLLKGIAFHHSGLAQPLREIVEIIFQKGLVKVLFATETFAVGVNMPTRTIVFTEVEKHDNSGRRFLRTAEYKQMAGRAGRRGIDKFGNVIILPIYDFPYKQELRTVMMGKLPAVQSRFEIKYSFLLKIIQSNSKKMDRFIKQSLFNRDNTDRLKQLGDDIKILEEELSKYSFTTEQKNKLAKYMKAEEEEAKLRESGIALNKAQKKERQKLNQELNKTPGLKKLFEKYQKFREVEMSLERAKIRMQEEARYVEAESSKIITLLRHEGYLIESDRGVNELTAEDVTVKGVVAAKIDDCNCLLMTEMLTGGVFDGLDPIEVVSLLGLFICEIKSDRAKMMRELECPDSVYNKIDRKIFPMIDRFIDQEEGLGIECYKQGYWDVYFDYVDIAFWWASGWTTRQIFDKLREYDVNVQIGNFVRCMQKLNNMVDNLVGLCGVCGREEYIPVMEQIKELIYRDIVVIDSLYLE